MTMADAGKTTEQIQIHPVMFETANQAFFGGRIKSNGDGLDLSVSYAPEVRKMDGTPDGKSLSEQQLRVLMFKIPGTKHARTSALDGSRANMK